jgi:lipopolysaccharide export system protein LptC
MRKRTAHRWRLTLILVVGTFVALGSFWLVQVVNQSGQEAVADQHRNEPDYIIENFSLVRLSKAGQPSYIVAGDKLTHRPVDDSSDIDKPVVHSLSATEGQPPMNMKADHAHVDQNNSRIQLSGHVDVMRPPSPQQQSLHMTTSALTVFPDEDRMETDKPVELQVGASTATGTSMTANNATRQVKLTRGTMVLPPRGTH